LERQFEPKIVGFLPPKRIPNTIRIFTVNIKAEFTIREALSPPVQRAAFELADLVGREMPSLHEELIDLRFNGGGIE